MLEYSFQLAMLVEFRRKRMITENEFKRLKNRIMKKYNVNILTP